MAAVVLDRTWLTNMATGGQLAFYTSGWTDQVSMPGEVRRYAGGRLRAVTRPGSAQQVQFTARMLSRADKDTLLDWRGVLLLLRDTQGRKVFGQTFGMQVAQYRSRLVYDVTLTLSQVTYSEAV